MENKTLKMNSKVSSELLNVLAKTVAILRDCELNEAFNRIEIQVREYEESKQPCDLTYLRNLCNQFDDKLTAVCKAKSEMVKLMMNPELIEKMGDRQEKGSEVDESKDIKNQKRVGFHS